MASEIDGICCPTCGSRWHEVTHTERLTNRTRRRRTCHRCGRRFVTVELTLADAAIATRSNISAKPRRDD